MANETGAWSGSDAAEAWKRSAAQRNAALAEATELMLDAAGVVPGACILDVATGTGDTAMLAALRVGPTGKVIATDIAPAMVEVAARTAREAGLAHVEARVMDGSRVDLPEGSCDGAISRTGLMFMPDIDAALVGVRRALRPGGRLGAIVWGPLERNPTNAIAIAAARAFGPLPSPTPEMVTAFTLGAPGRMEGLLAAAGYHSIVVRTVAITRRFPTLAELMRGQRDAVPVKHLFAHLSDRQREEAWAHLEHAYAIYDTPAGLCIPGETLVVSGSR